MRGFGAASADQALQAAATALLDGDVDWSTLQGRRLVEGVSRGLGDPSDSVSYLLLSCLHREVPSLAQIHDFTRRWRIEGLEKPLGELHGSRRARAGRRVRVESGVIVDVTDTGRSKFTTGIQRVARETLTRWAAAHDLVLVGWDVGNTRLVDSTVEESTRVVLDPAVRSRLALRSGDVVVPFGARFVLPEIAVDGSRAENIRTIATFSRSRSVAIGFDCIPITTAETSGPGMPGAFSKYLATLAQFDAVAPISSAALVEYSGWRRMLKGSGIDGPQVTEVTLPAQVESVDDETIQTIEQELALGDKTVVLAVGSHEPRKNHLNLLLAAELNWRAGREFTLVMVGGNAWGDDEFKRFVLELRRKGRPVSLLSGVDDSVIWSLYRLARFSVFCSVNEGFGLPVVESLASGTPVLTSDFGSMRELGEGFGALVADPHDPVAMSESIARLLDDDALVDELTALSATLERPTWDDYANDLWRLVEA